MSFRTPSLVGSSDEDSPSLTGWGTSDYQDNQESCMSIPVHEWLRSNYEPPSLETCAPPAEAAKTFALAMHEYLSPGIAGLWREPGVGDPLSLDPFWVATIIGARYSELSNAYNGSPTQSPIEDMLLGALLWMNPEVTVFPRFDVLGDGPCADADGCFGDDVDFAITAQAPIAGHRVDFLVWSTYGKRSAGIAIECDGHAFHEKTKEQAARDKKRDREILAAGYPVLRFAGSEVFADVTGCVRQILAFVPGLFSAVTKDSGST